MNPKTSIEELELSTRTYNCLKNDNLLTVGDIEKKTDAELLRTPNFGRLSLRELREMIPYKPEDPKQLPLATRIANLEAQVTELSRSLSSRLSPIAIDQRVTISLIKDIKARLDEHLVPDPTRWPVLEQFNQMGRAVNQLVAYANAIDTHKQELIELTSNRITALTEQLAVLRVRLRRLEANGQDQGEANV